MTDAQILTIALASVPTMITVLIGILINASRLSDLRSSVEARFVELRAYIDLRFNEVDRQFKEVDRHFDDVDRRLEDMKEIWRSELHRVEEVLDARLKHLEDR